MKKMNRMPHEQSVDQFLPGLPGTGGDEVKRNIADSEDVEGHGYGHTKGERLNPGLPGTGGDQYSRNVTGDGDDVEGHSFGHTKGERLNPGLPGTGGDEFKRTVSDDGLGQTQIKRG
jgi:hypothetical protein